MYVLICITDLIIVLIPIELFIFLAGKLTPEDANPLITLIFGIIGMIGSAAVALGLANIFMAALKQYLGHLFTLITLVGGILVDAFCLWMISIA